MPVTCSIVMLCPCTARAPEPIVDHSHTPPDLPKSGDEDGLVVSPPAASLPGAVAQASRNPAPCVCCTCPPPSTLDIPTPVTALLESGARDATQDWGVAVAELRAEVRYLREALSQPCQSCDASARLSSVMCQLQEDLKAHHVIIRSLERAVAELRQVHRVGAAPASDNPRRAEEATGQSLDNGSMDSPLPSQQAQAKRRRRPKAKTDLKGGASYQSASSSSGSTPSLFRVISANVTSLFSRDAAVCAIGFGVAFLAETALTARGQEILTVQLQTEGRCVVWVAPVEGAGVTSSRGVALLGGPGVRIAPLDVPDELSAQWRDGRIVAGKARLGCARQFTEVTCVACYADVYNATARETLFERL
eukprot:s14559_g1.t1